MSAGTPTALVKDGDVEGNDPVADDEPWKVKPTRIAWDVFDQSLNGP